MKSVSYLILIFALNFSSNIGSHHLSIPGTAANTSINPPVTLNKTLLLQLVNKIRQTGCKCGDTYYYPAPPLNWNDKLEAAAYNHSIDMFQHKYFSHIAPDGSKGGARIDAVGYHWMAYAENIGMGYKKEKEVVEAWIKSPEHCKNIMNKMYKEMGAARVGDYWTQDFGVK